jgi:cytochrome P450
MVRADQRVERASGSQSLFNPFAPGFREDPYQTYRVLRERDPVHDGPGMWVLTRYDDIRAVLGDLRFSSGHIPHLVEQNSRKIAGLEYPSFKALGENAIVFTDRPAHTRLRRLVGKAFHSSRVEGLRPFVAERAEAILSALPRRGDLDFMHAVAEQLPLQVMLGLMALDVEHGPRILRSTHDVRYLLEPTLVSRRKLERVHLALLEYEAFFRQVVVERSDAPKDDLISALLLAEHEGDRLSLEEVVSACIMSFVAGHETTRCLLGTGLLALICHPEQCARLRRCPELVTQAVEEMMRFDTPLQQTQRVATQDVVVGERRIASGDAVLLCLAAANRDPQRFPRADAFEIGRSPNEHVGFGYGIHGCIGSALARLEAEQLFTALLRHWRSIRLADVSIAWLDHSFILRGPKTLRVAYED